MNQVAAQWQQSGPSGGVPAPSSFSRVDPWSLERLFPSPPFCPSCRSDPQSLHERVFTVVFSRSLPRALPTPPSPPGKLGGQDSFESIESYDSCDCLTQSWSSQSSFNSLQRVPSYDSFDSEDYPAALPNHKPKGTFKDYVRDRADLNKDKPVIPAAALAGYTGRHASCAGRPSAPFCGWGQQKALCHLPGGPRTPSRFYKGIGETSLRGVQPLRPICL